MDPKFLEDSPTSVNRTKKNYIVLLHEVLLV